MAVSVLSTFASTSTTANNAERFGAWTLAGGGDRITLEAVDLSGTATAADIRVYVGGRRLHVVESATQQTTRGVVALELLAHEMPPSGARQVVVYWPSATRIHITAVEWSGTRQRPTPSSDVFFATSASAQNANLTGTAPSNGGALHMMAWFGGTSSWTLGSGQTKIGADNQQTTFLSVGGYETGLSSGSQASDCSVAAAAAPIGQLCMFLAEDAQGVSALDPTDGATGVSTSPTLELTTTATAVAGAGSLRVYETVAPSASPTVDDAATSSNATNATPFTVTIPTTSAGQRLLVIVVSDGASYSAGVITDTGSPSPWNGIYRGAGFLLCYRECDGTEPSTYDFATAPADGCVARAYLISGHDPDTPPEIGFAIGDSSTVNPPSLAFSWGTEPTLVFAFAGTDNGSTVSGSSYPSGYTGTGTQASTQATASDRAGLGWCYKSGVTAGSEDPGNFSLTAGEGWNGITVAIRPADPSVLADTIDASDATFSGTSVEFVALGLAPSTAHHAVLDAGAIVDFEGIRGQVAWNFTPLAAGSDVEITATEIQGAGQVEASGSPLVMLASEVLGGGMVDASGSPLVPGQAVARGGGYVSGIAVGVVLGAGDVRGGTRSEGLGTPVGVVLGAAVGGGRVTGSQQPEDALVTVEARGGGTVSGSAVPVFTASGQVRGGPARVQATGSPLARVAAALRGAGRALAAAVGTLLGAVQARGGGRVQASDTIQVAEYAPSPATRTRLAARGALRSRVAARTRRRTRHAAGPLARLKVLR